MGFSMVTLDLLTHMCTRTKANILQGFIEPLNTVAQYYDMFEDSRRVAGFLSQVAHESGGFTATVENLNYSAKGLMGTFKKYFPTEDLAKQYERKPEKIANRVYANRMKNGDEQSGDGYKFRGRGLIQLTGRDNYTKFENDLGMNLEDTITYLETPNGAVASAGWFWDNNKLNQYCDKDDFVTLTKRINGGTIGLEDRKHHYDIAMEYLQG
jgi:putative chitinase